MNVKYRIHDGWLYRRVRVSRFWWWGLSLFFGRARGAGRELGASHGVQGSEISFLTLLVFNNFEPTEAGLVRFTGGYV